DLAHAIRLGIKPFAELGANSEALGGSQVDSPCSCRAIFESAPVAMLQSRQVAEMRYKADITAGALKLPESRLIADLLMSKVDAEVWKDAILTKNVLQARNPATARRLTRLIRGRLETMGPPL